MNEKLEKNLKEKKDKHIEDESANNSTLEKNKKLEEEKQVEKNAENNESIHEQEENKEEKINALKEELDISNDKLLRALAENENTRKQMDKIRMESNKYGVQPLAREILNVVGNFDRALSSKNDSKENALEEGVILIQKEVLSILEKFNVKKINALGEDFDANIHQAMFEKESKEYKPGQVCEIVQEGYSFHDRLLRPALVGISKENVEEKEEKNEEDKDIENNSK